MNKELIIDVRVDEIDIAMLSDKKLIELTNHKVNNSFAVGDIYLGKVKKIMPGLNASFVDIGYEKDAFLHYLDLGPQFKSFHKYQQETASRKGLSVSDIEMEENIEKNGKISDLLTSGQWILVQVTKEPISTKGPRLTSEISVAGRNMVLMPFSNKVSISTKIKDLAEKKRLKKLLQSIIPNNYGVIIRTAAVGATVEQLDTELSELIKKFEDAFLNFRQITPPTLVLGEIDRTEAIVRDVLNSNFEKIFVNDGVLYKGIKEYISTISPDKKSIVNFYTDEKPIFEEFGVTRQIKSSFGKTVTFKSGAYLIIEHTEALHVIDVNSGNRAKEVDQESNAIEVNLAAADEIARQLRLRDMGGIIVIDFIDMHQHENRQKLFEYMREIMQDDSAKHTILPLTKFGLMQITRQRVRSEVSVDIKEECPFCKGTGHVEPVIQIVDKMETDIEYLSRHSKIKTLKIVMHPFIAAYLTRGFYSIRRRLKVRYGIKIKVEESMMLDLHKYSILDTKGNPVEF
ncbi:Rne/Rng family ribonuclease [Marinilabiliaceae bacterium JC040]|nr:Rne/Rng family ribonuclease [Marinilabiliaceae bacterium JC040]